MSLSLVGVWHVGVWNQTVWGYGVWREGNPEAPGGAGGVTTGRRRRRYPTHGTVLRDIDEQADRYVKKIEDEARAKARELTARERELRRAAVLRAKAAQPVP